MTIQAHIATKDDPRDATGNATNNDILETARRQVLEDGIGLRQERLEVVLRLPDEALPATLQLAHEVRLKHCGEDVEVEGIVSIKTGGCPEDCHFCSQSGLFDSPVRCVWLDIPELVKAAKETAATGATEFCIVAAVRGPDIKLMNQIKFAIDRINEAVDINIACSLGMLTQHQVNQLKDWGVRRYAGGRELPLGDLGTREGLQPPPPPLPPSSFVGTAASRPTAAPVRRRTFTAAAASSSRWSRPATAPPAGAA